MYIVKYYIAFWTHVNFYVRRRSVVAIIPALQPGRPGSIPGGNRIFNFYTGTECVNYLSLFCPVLSLAVALMFC